MEPQAGSVSQPGHVSVGPNQHGSGSSDGAEYRKLQDTNVFGVDQLNPIRPWSDVEAAGLTELASSPHHTRGRYLGIRGPAEKEGPVRACVAALPRWSGWLYAQ